MSETRSDRKKAENNYRLVIFDAIPDPAPVRELICGVTGLHPTDANQWIARAPGVMRYPMAQGEVRELLDGLFKLGVAAEAWRADTLPDLSHPRPIREVACLDEGIRVIGLRGEAAHWIPWPKIVLIAAGQVAQEDDVRDVVPPGWVRAAAIGLNAILRRPQMIARRQRSIRLPRDPVFEAILVREDPRIVFRIEAGSMKYTCLGDRLRPSASENFPILITDICQHTRDAYLPPSTKALIDGADPRDYAFQSPQALQEYATHRLLWAWYRRDRDRHESKDTEAHDTE